MNPSDHDPYCYPGTSVLKNLRELRNQLDLDRFEADATTVEIIDLKLNPLNGPFDLLRLQQTHRRIFGRVYAWAGELRKDTGTMKNRRASGDVVVYGASEYIPAALERTFAALKKENDLQKLDADAMARRLAYFYSEFDAIHPFREGNSRTLRAFASELSEAAGYRLAWSRTAQTEEQINTVCRARDRAVMHGDTGELEKIVAAILMRE